ncbi:MAG: acetyl-CoA carboxylase biotin carboxyl carrier protein subunit [Chloroflexi bacterium]|nr:acetyl-CoA carboxylase biotin carboxyl carrier protein subunit [Chloroflexota bacterium]
MPVPVAAPDAAGVPAPAAPPPVAAATPRPAPRPRTDRSAGVVTAPMPGVVLEVFATPGATLRRGDAVLVLEAMKMRNTIRCPKDGVVAEVLVAAGQPVGPGDVMVRLDLDLAPP